jgi:hypothetical protein
VSGRDEAIARWKERRDRFTDSLTRDQGWELHTLMDQRNGFAAQNAGEAFDAGAKFGVLVGALLVVLGAVLGSAVLSAPAPVVPDWRVCEGPPTPSAAPAAALLPEAP